MGRCLAIRVSEFGVVFIRGEETGTVRRFTLYLPVSALMCLALTVGVVAAARPSGLSERRAVSPGAGGVTILEPGAPDTLNPLLTRTAAGIDATAPVFDSLVRIDATGTAHPDLALSWRSTSNTRTWAFTLDPRARWHDGEPVTNRDVLFTLKLIRDAGFGASSTLGADHIATVALAGTDTVTVTLNAPYAPFLTTVGATPILPQHVLGAIPPAQLRAYAPFNRHPIGSGPYAVAEVTADGHVIEEANPDYPGGGPALQRLVFAPVASPGAALAAAVHDPTGATVLPPSLQLGAADVAGLGAKDPVRAVYTRSFAWTHLDLIEHGELQKTLVRRALALATPRTQIMAQVLRGHGQFCDGDQAPGTSVYEPKIYGSYHFSLVDARNRLARAGYSALPHGNGVMALHGQPLVITIWGDEGCASCAATAGLIAQSWRAAGIVVRVHLLPTSQLFGPRGPLYNPYRFTSPSYDAVLYTWINGPDPDDSAYWSRGSIVTQTHLLGGNFDGYSNPRVDTLVARALTTPNGPARDSLYRHIQRILMADQPDVFLYWADTVSVVPTHLQGYGPNPYSVAATWNVQQWRLTQ